MKGDISSTVSTFSVHPVRSNHLNNQLPHEPRYP